jgi:hypothetical protein
MADQAGEQRDYLIAHVHEALGRDPRVAELELDVHVAGRTVVVAGAVASEEERRAVTDVLVELLPDHRVVNETEVAAFPETDDVERL